ncbi:MAG: DUF1549 domain-containing protein [Planctomycetaceae bacterium]|nr:DUF1549 domain-containing protein [Planctomycetales bacterium]MCB9922747.1 DUF1549 domain-containing protein [Planctomycetaceae bacterium]
MRRLLVLFVLLLPPPAMLAADIDYERNIKPMLTEKCSACHGALKQEAGLRLDAATLIRQGGDSGAAIVPGSADGSLLFDRVTAENIDERMPPEGEGEPLTQEQLTLLRTWIERGAPSPADELIPTSPRDHWAYQVPQRAKVPEINDPIWNTNPIDAFVAEQHRLAGITPVELADEHTLVRRLYLDLIGLPPTRQQLDEFLKDESSEAYARLVDRLLDSPQYGERWGRHWMDVWRYSDWSGYRDQLRGSQRHIWRWRDWIIESLNADKSYDQMIVEMLAGDELAPEDFDVLRATGFLARNYHNSNRNIWLDATVEHTAKAFLGMTINCARCHDHKFDPFVQREYYALRAIFEPHNVRTERVPGQSNLMVDGLPRVFDAELDAKTFVFARGNEKHFDKDQPVSPGIPAIFSNSFEVTAVALPPIAVFPALWPHIEREELDVAERRLAAATKRHREIVTGENAENADNIESQKVVAAESALASLRARWAADKAKYLGDGSTDASQLAQIAADAERLAALHAAQVEASEKQSALMAAQASDETDASKKQAAIDKARKESDAAQQKVAKAEAAREENEARYTAVGKAYPATSTGRRLALARWIADRQNPLTARVAVNHMWMRHFGEPLVANVFDFGLRSPQPTHIALLDWLAVELMENSWSMKHLHRLMVTSRTYRIASWAPPELAAAGSRVDPDNLLLWRANVRRLDAEVIRDSVLQVAGSLDLQRGGPDIDFTEGESVPRRSVYIRHAYEKQMTMLVLFDAAGPNECYRRSESVIPQQALALANSSLSLSESRKLASVLWREVADHPDAEVRFVQLAFRQMLTRDPSESETNTCVEFLTQQAGVLAKQASLTDFESKTTASIQASDEPKMRARENLIHVLMNHNDFVSVR